MELEGSSMFSQKPATGPVSSDWWMQSTSSTLFKKKFKTFFPSTLGLANVFFLSGFWQTFCTHFWFIRFAPHSPSTPSSLIYLNIRICLHHSLLIPCKTFAVISLSLAVSKIIFAAGLLRKWRKYCSYIRLAFTICQHRLTSSSELCLTISFQSKLFNW